MKKMYIKPDMQVYEINKPQLLAGSDPEIFNEPPEDGNDLNL